MAVLEVPHRRSQYEKNCINETERSVLGRDNRRPIHDAINYTVGMTVKMHAWCEGIGLCVQNGMLSVIYGS